MNENCDVLVIGAGPAGSVAAALLHQQGHKVIVIEREQFPRFSIGESLLPQSMQYIEEAGMLQAVVEAGFQFKEGAAFMRGSTYTDFDFRDKHSLGWGTTYQVERAHFDHVLAKDAERQGLTIRYQQQVTDVDLNETRVTVNNEYSITAKFILDASGFGRVLPRLLNLETPSNFPVRGALFTHVEDHIPVKNFDRNKIRITVHPKHCDVWYWTIPFSNGRCSLGVVAENKFLEKYKGNETSRLQTIVNEDPSLCDLLKHATWDTPARQIVGYAANVKSLYGKNYALLGNAGEFLDPVFSSGVTIAVKSASLAAKALKKHLNNETVDWEQEYAIPLKKGVDTFRTFVEAWYDGRFQKIIFYKHQQPTIRRMISAVLAGYAWDETNPFVKDSKRYFKMLEDLCNMA